MQDGISVAKTGDIPPGKSIGVNCHGEEVAVFNLDGVFYACSDRCPHAGAPLKGGIISGTVISCPWHGWRFDLASGPDAPKDGVLRYPVEVDGEDVVIGPPVTG
jgi:nitrite reductase (NADH) small subunit